MDTDGKNILKVAGLVLFILAAVGFSIIRFTDWSPGSGERVGLHFKCTETGEEFVYQSDKLPDEWKRDMMNFTGPTGPVLKNPATGKRTVVMMTKCPNCQEYFVPAETRSVCPKCKTNLLQWKKNRQKQ